jgi:hypothetical protein
METISKMDKKAAQQIRAEAQKALEVAAEKLGLKVSLGNGRFDPSRGTFDCKIEFVVPAALNESVASDLKQFGIDGAHGTEFTVRGTTYSITGVNFRATRMPINVTEVSSGRGFKFESETVKRALGQQVAASFTNELQSRFA